MRTEAVNQTRRQDFKGYELLLGECRLRNTMHWFSILFSANPRNLIRKEFYCVPDGK